jgi:putative ABC transport system permease protein
MVLREVLVIAGLGIAIGVPLTLSASRVARANIEGLTVMTPLLLVAVLAVLGVVAALAASLPAWRAARINPSIAFREV